MKISKYSAVATVIIIVLLWLFWRATVNNNRKLAQINELYKTSQDSLITYRNQLDQQVAKSSVLIAEKQAYLLQINTKDEQIIELQNLVKSETKKRHDIEVAMVFKNTTISKLKDSISNIVGQTVEHKGDSTFIYPIYQRSVSDKWITEDITIGKNLFKRDLYLTNDYNVVIGSESSGLFKRKQFAEITSLNPYSSTVAMKVYQKKETPSRFWDVVKYGGLGVAIGILIGHL